VAKQPGQPADLGAQLAACHLTPGGPCHLGEGPWPGNTRVLRAELGDAGRVGEQRAHRRQGVVACRAGARPVRRQLLTQCHDLFRHDPASAGRDRKLVQVSARIRQPVHVVDPEPRDQALSDQAEEQAVCGGEHVRLLDPDRDQRRYVEETAPVEERASRSPAVKPVGLGVEQITNRQRLRARTQRQYALTEAQNRLVAEVCRRLTRVGRDSRQRADAEVVQAVRERAGQYWQHHPVARGGPVNVEPMRVR
jgi:hypothetical protein